MYTTDLRKTKTYYSSNPFLWIGHETISSSAESKAWNEGNWSWGFEYTCTDSFASEVIIAIDQLDNPQEHTTYNTIEEFLDSLN